jgi:hypothetical protein
MEQRNFQYLTEEVLPKLGFAGVLDKELETKMKGGEPEIELRASSKKADTEMLYALKLRKGDGDFYFLNSVKATRTDKDMKPVEQTFGLFKQTGYTAEEMKNMLREGASVYRTYRREGQTVGRWTRLDLGKTNEEGNHPMRSYYDSNTNFNLARELSKLPVIHASQEEKEILLKALQGGERASVAIRQNGQKERMYIEATPHLGVLTLFNSKMEKITMNNNTMAVVKDEKKETKATEQLPDTTRQLMQKIQNTPSEGQQVKKKIS